MKAYIESIGLIDHNGKVHSVNLKQGLNIITGRSSTGKSAIISIFDYCFGNRINNIARGVISDRAEIYFVIIRLAEGTLVLGRKEAATYKGFFKPENSDFCIGSISTEYFAEEYYIPLDSYLEKLGEAFGLTLTDTDEVDGVDAKSGRPSVRNMISFLLQSQNLVANNQALFYRFDDVERRDKVISEFKIFIGLVDQNFYLLSQAYDKAKKKKKGLERHIASLYQQIEIATDDLDNLRRELLSISNTEIFPGVESSQIISAPQLYVDQIDKREFEYDETTSEYPKQYEEYLREQNKILGEIRELQLKFQDLQASIRAVDKYESIIHDMEPAKEAFDMNHVCPFCKAHSNSTQNAANALTKAIEWLNVELGKTPTLKKNYLTKANTINSKIEEREQALRSVKSKIAQIIKIASDLKKNRSIEQQANAKIERIKILLLSVVDFKLTQAEGNLEEVKRDIEHYKNLLDSKYNIDSKLKEIEIFINNSMNQIAAGLNFEEDYKPVDLQFNSKKFMLSCKTSKELVPLSAMGSAANWLYSHLCLFLSFSKLFCKYEQKCTIPPILFIDQPSQVYFPTQIFHDNDEKFDAHKLKGSNYASEDMIEVTNMFTRILDFIESVYSEFGIRPQIIITEHADNLNVDPYNFNEYVVGRWREAGRGLIDLTQEMPNEDN